MPIEQRQWSRRLDWEGCVNARDLGGYGTADRGRPQMVPFLSKRAGTDGWKVAAENLELKGSATLVVQEKYLDFAQGTAWREDRADAHQHG